MQKITPPGGARGARSGRRRPGAVRRLRWAGRRAALAGTGSPMITRGRAASWNAWRRLRDRGRQPPAAFGSAAGSAPRP